MKNIKGLDFIKLIIFIFCFAGIPLFMVLTGYYYSLLQNKNIYIKDLSQKFSTLYTKFSSFEEQERFWYLLFEENIKNNITKSNNITESLTKIANSFKELKKDYDFEYIVYNPNYKPIFELSSDSLGGTPYEKKIALNAIWNYKIKKVNNFNHKVEEILGKVFGPQFYVGNLNTKYITGDELQLCWTDSQYKRRLIWNCFIQDCLVLALIKPDSLTDIKCLETYIKKVNKEQLLNNFPTSENSKATSINTNSNYLDDKAIGFSIKNNNIFLHPSSLDDLSKKEIEKADSNYVKNRSMLIESENYYIFPKYLRPDVTIYGYFNKSNINPEKTSIIWNIGIVITITLTIVIIINSWKIIILKKLENISIKWKLGFLFFFANGLPLLVLIFIGNEFLSQARTDYIQKIMKEGTAFLQDFDEKYEIEYAKCIIRKEKYKNELKDKKTELDKNDCEKLFKLLSPDTAALFLVASSGQTIISNSDGTFKENDFLNNPENLHSNSKRRGVLSLNSSRMKDIRKQLDFSNKLGHFILNKLNNKDINENESTEMELILESTLRKKIDSFVFELIDKLGYFMTLGIGQNVHHTLLDTISLSGKRIHDYFILATIRTYPFQKHYLEKSIIQANRNEMGLKIISWNSINGFIPEVKNDEPLKELAKRLNEYPLEEAIFIKNNDTEYIAMGFDSKHIEKSKLIGLYPTNLIDNYIKTRRNELIAISLLSILMTVFLSSIIIKSFLKPLSEISIGAKSIEQKNFQYRLPELGRNEFGSIGKIFNEVVVDLEELSLTRAIQEQLLPSSEIKTGNFSLYGKSVPMNELGGDYFDFIQMENDKFSIALGDVAGHGVGASLIMAMAKAALIKLDTLWEKPVELIFKLHDMIYKSKTKKQKKFMTFQYMYLDGKSGQAVYSNAGGCSPIVIRKATGKVEELTLPGAVLGALKKAKYSEIKINFNEGDAVVFYTDGIVECKNHKDVMLGYDDLKIIFEKSYDENAENFYKNIYKSYLKYIGGDESKANDDVTIVVLVYKNKGED